MNNEKNTNVLVIGAGSIGNHLSNACRTFGWNVSIYDVDEKALDRTKKMIYPQRYGKWDENIKLLNEIKLSEKYDVVIIGTPPDTHIKITKFVLESIDPKIILIEKPLSVPNLESLYELKKNIQNDDSLLLVGYNHNLTDNTKFVESLISRNFIGDPLAMHVKWMESWDGIFEAHPWLDGPQDSYLGYYNRGGGACGEHSHAISIWNHFSKIMNCGKISAISSLMDIYKNNNLNYDRSTFINLKSEHGLHGTVLQDVITTNSLKNTFIQGSDGYVSWFVNYDENNDAVIYSKGNKKEKIKLFPKHRPDDFKGEIVEIARLLQNPDSDSPISFENGFDCMKVISASFESAHNDSKIIYL